MDESALTAIIADFICCRPSEAFHSDSSTADGTPQRVTLSKHNGVYRVEDGAVRSLEKSFSVQRVEALAVAKRCSVVFNQFKDAEFL